MKKILFLSIFAFATTMYAQINIQDENEFYIETDKDYYTHTNANCKFLSNIYTLKLNKDSTFTFRIFHKYDNCDSKVDICDTTWGTFKIEGDYLILNSDSLDHYQKRFGYQYCICFTNGKVFIINNDELLYSVRYINDEKRQIILRRKN